MPLVDPLTDALVGDTANSLFQTLRSNLGIVPKSGGGLLFRMLATIISSLGLQPAA
jgi:hypothetical protein